jgi:hypothetical protein
METVISEINEREYRRRNLIIYGVEESKTPNDGADRQKILALMTVINPDIGISNISHHRLGKPVNGKPRPLKVRLMDNVDINQLLKNFGRRKYSDSVEQLRNISISRDKTLTERQYVNKLREELNTRISAGESDLSIKYVSGIPKIVNKPSKNESKKVN